MARTRTPRTAETPAPRRGRPPKKADDGQLAQVARRMVEQIEQLVAELATVRQDNDALRAELRDAVQLLEKASSALGTPAGRRGRGRRTAAAAETTTRTVTGTRGRRTKATGRGTRGRATPASVTPDVVRSVIGKIGPATAARIAEELTKLTGSPVNGRAVRFLAERGGAAVEVVDGQRQYRLG